ncbi:VirK/YbjX family protein [Gallibacterium salpingitidis]|uniref:Membrane protein n=1 Tax=Gallibacterium salpingitidis TaxID=505341 RepID=A0A1A7P0C6_9PAST|nr:DUF535 family protein [Gallibacterium salpingitidis]OBW95285.1 membrane protein [Gallibacterium salpingitidis]
MSNNYYQWPQPISIYPDRENKSYRLKRFRFQLRTLIHYHSIKKFTRFVNQHSWLVELLNPRADWSYPVAHRFLDKRFSTQQRFDTICDNLTFLPQKFTSLGLKPLWEQSINFGEVIPDFELILTLNNHQPMEGYWALELLHKPSDELMYLLTFGKVDNALLIAVIQGANCKGSKEFVKLLTKKCHGLRPAYLMIEAMKALTIHLGYSQLLGIPQKYQNKSRFFRNKRYVVNYDVIFQESGGKLQKYWQLPLQIEMKKLEDIPSNKRSMYRKRYAMLNDLSEAIGKGLKVI